MPTKKTFLLTQEAAISTRKWHVVDVAGKTLGRAATQIAHLLRGKHKTSFTPHVDSGDFVVVINASKVELTGNKWDDKPYRHHTLFPGGLKTFTAKQQLARKPEVLIERAVWGMLPKGPLGRKIYKKLKVYPGASHPHTAQEPQTVKLANS